MFSSFKSNVLTLGVALTQKPNVLLLPFFLVTIVWNWSTHGYFFFWDTTQLASEHAQFFYDSNFSTLLLPERMDSGHPPVFGLYLALCWKLFGKTLTISHLAMLPFLLGIIFQAWQLGRQVLGDAAASVFVMALAVNPVIAGQSVLVSPDVVLLFFFLLSLNALFAYPLKKMGLTIAILGLAMVSSRGMMVAAALFLYQIGVFLLDFYDKKAKKYPPQYFEENLGKKQLSNLETEEEIAGSGNFESFPNLEAPKYPPQYLSHFLTHFFKILLPYLAGGLFSIAFLLHHYFAKGWIGYNTTSGWSEAFQMVDFQEFIKNLVKFIWRLVDFGHIFPVLLIGFWLLKMPKPYTTTRHILLLLIALLLVLSPTLILHKGLLTHRYLLPIYATICLLALRIVSDLKNYRIQLAWSSLIVIGLATGNFWVYPQPIATGWDATLAHLPYYRLRRDMLQFIDNQQISYSEIGTTFPNQRSFAHTDLNFSSREVAFATLDFSKNTYIFYSNVMNDFSADDLETLKRDWEIVKILRGGQVEIILYRKR